MKLLNFGMRGAEQLGLLVNRDIVPLAPVLADMGVGPLDANTFIALSPQLKPALLARLHGAARIPADGVRIGAPISGPRTIFAVGFNYRQHGRDVLLDLPFPQTPILFLKAASSIVGPRDAIMRPPETTQLDYELELGVVIGRPCHRVDAAQALNYVFGYVVANDVTARDIALGESKSHPLFLQVARGKGAPSFCPLGPWIATADELAPLEQLRMQLWVNDVLRQDDVPASMAVGVPELISSVSQSFALSPGDLILTGTPGGCAFQSPDAAFLKPGDIVRAHIAGLGEMVNTVIDEAMTEG